MLSCIISDDLRCSPTSYLSSTLCMVFLQWHITQNTNLLRGTLFIVYHFDTTISGAQLGDPSSMMWITKSAISSALTLPTHPMNENPNLSLFYNMSKCFVMQCTQEGACCTWVESLSEIQKPGSQKMSKERECGATISLSLKKKSDLAMDTTNLPQESDNPSNKPGSATPSASNAESPSESSTNTAASQDAKKKRTGPKRRKVTHGESTPYALFEQSPTWPMLIVC